MPSPFPGMDPWLERPALWPGVHQSLVTYTRDALQPRLGDRYFVEIGERIYVESSEGGSYYPDVAVVEAPGRPRSGSAAEADRPMVVVLQPIERREVYLEIRDAATGDRVVTVIEFLSPANKRPGPGRDLYLAKQADILASQSHLVEVDLLRAGAPTVALPPESIGSSAYRVVVSSAVSRNRRELYPVGLRDRLPRVAIPLLPGDSPVVLDLGAVFAETFEKGAYGRRVDYGQPPEPPLAPDDAAWARALLAAVGR